MGCCALALQAVGCGKQEPPPAPAAKVQPGSGSIVGSVTFIGKPPTLTSSKHECCGNELDFPDESVVVNANGTLANVVVYLKNGPNAAIDLPAAVLDQKDCRYVPHVVALRTGQTLEIHSSDPTLHNVNFQSTANPPKNFGQTSPGAVDTVTFDKPEFMKVKCDVHPWMGGQVAVFDHPYFDVTGEDGSFKIDHVPDGTYTLVAWQERIGTVEQSITVGGGKPTDVKLEFKGP